jgi:glutathione S-transferase
MPKVTIHGSAGSTFVTTARMACVEKGIEHELQPVQLRSDAHRALHPWQKMPVLRDGAFVVFETSAIVRYLDATYGGTALFPSDPRTLALAEQWISVAASYLYPHLIKDVVLGYVFPKGRDGKPDLAVIRAHVPAAEADVAVLDDRLADSAWLAGDTFSAGDLFAGAMVGAFRKVPEGKEVVEQYEHVQRWLGALKERPSGLYL